jgi:predicted transposase/invertase (TIGR01784 family)
MTQREERTLVSFDWAMKHILRDKANFDVLEGFLSALLNDEMRVLSLLESETNQEHELDKYNRVDLLTVDSNEQIVLIELQYTWQPAYLKRLLYGTAKLIVEHIQVGQPFDQVRKVISISILYFPVSQDADDYLYHGKTEFTGLNTGKLLRVNMAHLPKPEQPKPTHTPQQNGAAKADDDVVNIFPEYYLIEVGHFQNLIRHPIDEWIYLFKNSAVRDDFHSRNIQAAKAKLTLMHMSAAERKGYEQFLLSRANALDVMTGHFQQGVEQGMTLGKEQGMALGKEEANRDNARKMRDEGLDPTLIARITGLSEAEIGAL